MFDVAPTELLLVAVVALIVIGPKDLPKAMRVVGYWVGRARGVARHFRSGMDEMMRQAEMEEMEKRWKTENDRIMREHPATPEIEPAYTMTPLPGAPAGEAPPPPAETPPPATDETVPPAATDETVPPTERPLP